MTINKHLCDRLSEKSGSPVVNVATGYVDMKPPCWDMTATWEDGTAHSVRALTTSLDLAMLDVMIKALGEWRRWHDDKGAK